MWSPNRSTVIILHNHHYHQSILYLEKAKGKNYSIFPGSLMVRWGGEGDGKNYTQSWWLSLLALKSKRWRGICPASATNPSIMLCVSLSLSGLQKLPTSPATQCKLSLQAPLFLHHFKWNAERQWLMAWGGLFSIQLSLPLKNSTR